jgi:multimeric flavodoxin WrbA
MKILGIVASPHTEGLTAQMVRAVLDGAAAAGAETQVISLGEQQIDQCRGCRGADCWETGRCQWDEGAEQRNKALGDADALVFGAPVYMHDLAGIAKSFIDKVRVPPRRSPGPFLPTNGKPALGITIAGGTGKGVLTSLQAIYYGLFLICGYRGLQPLPVTRFNLKACLAEAGPRGRGLAGAERAPFREDGLADRLAYYQAIEMANSSPVMDNLFLARVLVSDISSRKQLEEYREADTALRRAEALVEAGQLREAAGPVWEAYQQALIIWENDPG